MSLKKDGGSRGGNEDGRKMVDKQGVLEGKKEGRKSSSFGEMNGGTKHLHNPTNS